jgi:hypothetical protein
MRKGEKLKTNTKKIFKKYSLKTHYANSLGGWDTTIQYTLGKKWLYK